MGVRLKELEQATESARINCVRAKLVYRDALNASFKEPGKAEERFTRIYRKRGQDAALDTLENRSFIYGSKAAKEKAEHKKNLAALGQAIKDLDHAHDLYQGKKKELAIEQQLARQEQQRADKLAAIKEAAAKRRELDKEKAKRKDLGLDMDR